MTHQLWRGKLCYPHSSVRERLYISPTLVCTQKSWNYDFTPPNFMHLVAHISNPFWSTYLYNFDWWTFLIFLFVCLFLTILHCKVSMVLSGDLVAPRTDLCCSGLSARQGPSRQGSLARIILSYGPLCKGNGNTGPKPHGPHDGTINLCSFTPMLHIRRGASPNQQ